MIFQHFQVKPWILIDEYDAPIHAGYLGGSSYYAHIIEWMRDFLGNALKDNPYLNRAIVTGILRIAKESLFSGVLVLGVDLPFKYIYHISTIKLFFDF